MMHYHKCGHKLANNQVCGQIVAVCGGQSCEQDHDEHFCSIHHPDPAHYVPPTPPPKK
jgi:hypothetical protein